MKQLQGLSQFILTGAAVLAAIQPAIAAPVKITAVQVNPTDQGVNVQLQTSTGARPQVFSVNRGSRWTADVTNSQLKLPKGGTFRQDNPAPGISSVTVAPLDANSVRVTVVGQSGSLQGQVTRPAGGGLFFGVSRATGATAAVPALPKEGVPIRVPQVAQATPAPVVTPAPALPPGSQTVPAVPATPGAVPPVLPATSGSPLVPNPEITIQDPRATRPPVATYPRAIAPPVGDIAAAQVDASPGVIDLGTAERVPRLVLRDAPAREVLSLLARAAGMNIAFTDTAEGATAQQQPTAPGQTATTEGPRISLDIENESVQDVFNYVLRLSGLEANRLGRTIFVGRRLPNSARNIVVRSLRLNQIPVSSALNFLVALGAESAVARERLVTSVNAVPVAQLAGGGTASAVTQTQTTTEQRIETQRVNYQDSTPVLRGLQASGDERANQVTLIGTPRQVEIAISQLVQLDVRRRQVVVNVRVIDVNLLALDRASSSFSFGINDTSVSSNAGVAVINFGRRAPGSTGVSADSIGSTALGIGNSISNGFNFTRGFLLQLQAAVTSGNAKLLTDPSLVVQEGQTATVNLTQEVVTNLTQQTTATANSTQTTLTVEKARAGLILGVKVDRIDDNGFVALSVAPSISQPSDTISVNTPGVTGGNEITLLSERRLESGQVRLRDGQTLVLSGIIQESDRTSVTKVPILGDIPLLGALFRRTNRENERREVIVLVTPRILDDSDRSTFGYTYTPGPDVQRIINQAPQPLQ